MMTHLPEVFGRQQAYEQTFKQRYVDIDDPRRIVLAYKAGQMLNRFYRRDGRKSCSVDGSSHTPL